MIFDKDLLKLSERLGKVLKENDVKFATAESCTGGNIAGLVTAVSGSSEYFKGGIVAYSNEVKTGLLQVKEETLKTYGAVSEQTVIEMVKGAMKVLNADCAVATSGIAGPTGGTPAKPVGTIWIAVGKGDEIMTYRQKQDDGRLLNIENTVKKAIEMVCRMLQKA